ncbi:adenosine deaminase [Sciscionella marina]|uniref:adenosine deaminase n=1 Tax=Sciscionella marina TaxID=508770 RepID=UPI001969A3F7|nr:adenosine deaminase [Sciscionella marina]
MQPNYSTRLSQDANDHPRRDAPLQRRRSLVELPKAHLHVHLTGMMRPHTLAELASRHDVAVPAPVEDYPNFDEFVRAYRAARSVLHTTEELARLVEEMVEDAAEDGAVWIEPSLSLRGYRPITGGDQDTLQVVLDAARQASERFGTGVGVIVAAERGDDPVEAERAAVVAGEYADRGVVGFGLGGDERHPPSGFARAFAFARESGLLSVPHAGELDGPQSIRATLEQLSPHRILHGVRAAEDSQLVEQLHEQQVCLDVCPSSNRALGVTPDLAAHPLPTLVRAGVACSINTDATLPFRTTLAREYELCRAQLGLTDHELADVARASLRASAAPAQLASTAIHAIDTWISR